MLKFDKSKIKEFENYLYKSNIHDSELESGLYDRQKDMLSIKLINPIYNIGINFIFHDIDVVFSKTGKELGSNKTIISLTIEQDYSYIYDNFITCDNGIEHSLYLLFQMLSGDELHIVSKSVEIRTEQEHKGTVSVKT